MFELDIQFLFLKVNDWGEFIYKFWVQLNKKWSLNFVN